MGLMDILNGMSNGPRGQAQPKTSQGGGMSPMTMGLLALLAYKAFKSGALGGLMGQSNPVPQPQPQPLPQPGGFNRGGFNPGGLNPGSLNPGGTGSSIPGAGGLESWLRGALGGAVAGGATGAIVNGGLGELVKRFQQNGYGAVSDSWVGTGPNHAISPGDLAKAAGVEDIDALAQEMGMPRDQVLARLSSELPDHVDSLTPQGRIEEYEEEDEDEEEDDDKNAPRR